jgi:tetratricopeptide (TPR) repeat protein
MVEGSHTGDARPKRPATIGEAIELAHAAIRNDEPSAAEALTRGVLRSAPGHAEAAAVLAHALSLQGRLAEAVGPLRKALRRASEPRLLTLLAKALREAGDSNEALRLLRDVAQRPPTFPLAVVEFAELLSDAGRLQEASDALEAAIVESPDEPVLRVALGHARLRANLPAQAREIFEAVRRRTPERWDATVGLARTLAREGEHLRAAKLFAAVLELRPHDAPARVALAKSLLELGRTRDAEANLRLVAQAPHGLGEALTALTLSARGRAFLRPSAAAAFLRVEWPTADAPAGAGDSGPAPAGSRSATRASAPRRPR